MNRMPWDSFGWWFVVTALVAAYGLVAFLRWTFRELRDWWTWRRKR